MVNFFYLFCTVFHIIISIFAEPIIVTMSIIRKILACFTVICSVVIFAGCGETYVYKIGVSQCSQDDWRKKMNDEMLREVMFHEDVVVEIRSADDNSSKQIDDIRYFKENDFDILIVSPNEAVSLTPVIREVYNAGMPVIIFDRNITGDTYTARIGVDDEGIGRAAAHYAFHLLGPGGRAIEIYGLRGSTPAEGRHKGFSEEWLDAGGELIASESANWNMEDAVRLTDSLLKLYADVDLIYAHNDRMAIGASEVARRMGRDNIRIIGIDAAPNIGIQAVADSLIDATFLYPTEGHRVIRTAISILKGEPYDREIILPASSAVDISNADILLRQNEALYEETNKIMILKRQLDDYWARHSSQTSLFYASIVIIVLLFILVFTILRTYWQHKKHQSVLLEQNHILEIERDKQRELNQRLEEATQSKLMFFTNVSHDLRTPLTLIAEPVAQLADASNLSPQQHTMMKIADKNVRILRRLINQILDFRKYENDRMVLSVAEIPLGNAVKEWFESFLSIARKRQMHMSLEMSESDAAATVAVDPEKIERVFFNLISNALKYTPAGGDIAITYSIVNDEIVISVSDTGEGISERDLGNIFDRFYQVDRVHPNGSGIGLSLCKAFIELHGGKIIVESTLKKGSVFTVTIPVSHTSTVPSEPLTPNITAEDIEAELDVMESDVTFSEDKPLLLIIDDNRDIQKLITELMGQSYNVISAINGKEGLSKAVKYVPDVIICDVMMPVMDGLECCRQLKAETSTSHIPVLMLTACSMDEQRVQGYDSGADGYLSKPFSGNVLKSRVAALIANRRRIQELWGNPATAVAWHASILHDKPTVAADRENDFYSRFLEIFRSEISNSDLSVDMIASKMGLVRTQFYRKIKALTNFSPVELIRNLRLQEAQILLKTTDRTISEIAYETGFSTPAYFTRCYREKYGETPTDTRNRLVNP